jgi:hypothetical protein
MANKIYIQEDGYSPLFAARRKHADIKKSYPGTPPSWYDRWITDDGNDETHNDWEQGAFLRAGWIAR